MKILFVDTSVDGHHLNYMNLLASSEEYDSIFLLPKKPSHFKYKTYISNYEANRRWDIMGYLKWMRTISTIAEKENVNIIHFLYSDAIYRFIGLGFSSIAKKRRIAVTQHWLRQGFFRRACFAKLAKSINQCIVHTEHIQNELTSIGVNNVVHIEYPAIIDNKNLISQKEAKEYWNLPSVPIFAILGGTRYDKGLDLLLKALNHIKTNYALLIVGYEDEITIESIESMIDKYKDKVHIFLNDVSDEQFDFAAIAADCIILPYRKVFDGASGPLTYGVWNKKYIIGPNHGSLGNIINENELGDTFEAENIESLVGAINKYLDNGSFKCSNKYLNYKNSLQTDNFINEHLKLYSAL